MFVRRKTSCWNTWGQQYLLIKIKSKKIEEINVSDYDILVFLEELRQWKNKTK